MHSKILKRLSLAILLFTSALVLSGCVSFQQPVEMNFSKWQPNKTSVAILVKELPTPYTHKAGSQGLLDVAINNATASTLTKHVKSLDLSEFYSIKEELTQTLSNKGVSVKLLDSNYKFPELDKFEKEGNFTKVNYSAIKSSLGTDQLLVINATQVGTIRDYYGFIPLGAPRSIFTGLGQLIDLSNNEVLWHKPVNIQKVVPGNWDEESYPGLTNVIFQTLNQGKSELIAPFKAP